MDFSLSEEDFIDLCLLGVSLITKMLMERVRCQQAQSSHGQLHSSLLVRTERLVWRTARLPEHSLRPTGLASLLEAVGKVCDSFTYQVNFQFVTTCIVFA